MALLPWQMSQLEDRSPPGRSFTRVLPAGEGVDDTGKDLGILTTAVNVPQILSPVFAAMLLGATGNDYPLLFIVAGLFVLAGAGLVLPIKSVRSDV